MFFGILIFDKTSIKMINDLYYQSNRYECIGNVRKVLMVDAIETI